MLLDLEINWITVCALWTTQFFSIEFLPYHDKYTQKLTLSHYLFTFMPMESFVVHKTFLELHSKTALQHSPRQLQ